MLSPVRVRRWALCTSRSRMASARVGSPMTSCHWSTGIWLVRIVEPRPRRSSRISKRSTRWFAVRTDRPQSSRISEVDAAERLQQQSVAAIAPGERQGLEEPRDALVEDGAAVAVGLVAERADDPTLADAAWAGDQAVFAPTSLETTPSSSISAYQTASARRRRSVAPARPKPPIIRAHVAGSGTTAPSICDTRNSMLSMPTL